jgi:hypothetical protein
MCATWATVVVRVESAEGSPDARRLLLRVQLAIGDSRADLAGPRLASQDEAIALVSAALGRIFAVLLASATQEPPSPDVTGHRQNLP